MKKIKTYVTAKDTGERLSYAGEASFKPDLNGEEAQIVNVYDEVKYQEIIGFGGAFTEAVSTTFDKLPRDKQEEILQAYFGPEGNGYTLCRTHINSCDFSLGNYAYVEEPDDVELKTFDIGRDRSSLLPMIKRALKVGEFNLIASPWSPPGWMKDTGIMNRGGKLLEKYRDVWARYYARYIKEYSKEGVNIWGITVQNEPKATQTWDSCVYSDDEERDFVRDHLGPVLEKEGLADVKIMVWDHNKERLFDRVHNILKDEEAAKYVWGGAFHWYSGDHFEAIDALSSLYPDKHWIFTEGCQEGGVHLGSWDTGERYGHHILGDLSHGAHGWCEWNMILDEMGGPNHVGNYCDAPIIADTTKGELIYESSYYYIGHFSRFIRPGARRIASTRYTDRLEVVACENTDGSIVVVALNRTDEAIPFNLRYKGKLASLESKAHSICTMVIE